MYVKEESWSMLMHRISGIPRNEFCRHAMKFVERRKYRGNMWWWV